VDIQVRWDRDDIQPLDNSTRGCGKGYNVIECRWHFVCQRMSLAVEECLVTSNMRGCLLDTLADVCVC